MIAKCGTVCMRRGYLARGRVGFTFTAGGGVGLLNPCPSFLGLCQGLGWDLALHFFPLLNTVGVRAPQAQPCPSYCHASCPSLPVSPFIGKPGWWERPFLPLAPSEGGLRKQLGFGLNCRALSASRLIPRQAPLTPSQSCPGWVILSAVGAGKGLCLTEGVKVIKQGGHLTRL